MTVEQAIDWLKSLDLGNMPPTPFKVRLGENHNGKPSYLEIRYWRLYVHTLLCELLSGTEGNPRMVHGVSLSDTIRLKGALDDYEAVETYEQTVNEFEFETETETEEEVDEDLGEFSF